MIQIKYVSREISLNDYGMKGADFAVVSQLWYLKSMFESFSLDLVTLLLSGLKIAASQISFFLSCQVILKILVFSLG